MVLPTGEVLVGGSEVYTSSGTYRPSWAPAIHSVPTTVVRGSTYKITGTQFNGLSQAAAFGDEYQTATNYPLVRITNNSTGHVFYAKTHDHSTMGVATGTKVCIHQLRRSRGNGNRSKLAGGGSQRNSVATGEHHSELDWDR